MFVPHITGRRFISHSGIGGDTALKSLHHVFCMLTKTQNPGTHPRPGINGVLQFRRDLRYPRHCLCTDCWARHRLRCTEFVAIRMQPPYPASPSTALPDQVSLIYTKMSLTKGNRIDPPGQEHAKGSYSSLAFRRYLGSRPAERSSRAWSSSC